MRVRVGICLFFLVSVAWAERRPNIVLITFDSLGSDRVGFLGSKLGLTPALDVFAHHSAVFERAYAQVPLTAESMATILTGMYPLSNHVDELGGLVNPSVPTLPQLLGAAGYRTAAFTNLPQSVSIDPLIEAASQFDRHSSSSLYVDRLTSQITRWVTANHSARLFLWIRLTIPVFSTTAAYNHSIKETDFELGKVLESLRSTQLEDDAFIVVTSTHGEGLGAHGEFTHGVFLYDQTVHVPLLLKLPKNEMAGERISAPARLIDVAPTIMELAGVTIPSQMQGQSLRRIARNKSDETAYSSTNYPQQAFGWSSLEALRKGKYLYVRAPHPELYDLAADPESTRNLVESSKAIGQTMAGQLNAFDRRLSGARAETDGNSLNAGEMQKLASLGYVGLQKTNAVTSSATGSDPKDGIELMNQVEASRVLLERGPSDKAISALLTIAKSDPKVYLVQYSLGLAYASKHAFPEAVEHLRAAIELQPGALEAHYHMAESLMKMGDFSVATVHLEIVTSRVPDFLEAHSLLADAYARAGRAADARREHDKVSLLSKHSD